MAVAFAFQGFERQLSDSWAALTGGSGSIQVLLDGPGKAFESLCRGLEALPGFERAAYLRFDPRQRGIGPFSPLAEGLASALATSGDLGGALDAAAVYPRHRPLWKALLSGAEPRPEEPLIPFEAAQERIFLRRDLERLCALASRGSALVIVCDHAEDLPAETLEVLDPEAAARLGAVMVLLRFGRRPRSSRRDDPAGDYFRELLSHGRVFILEEGAAEHAAPPVPALAEIRGLLAFLHFDSAARRATELFQASVRQPGLLAPPEAAELRILLAEAWAGAGNPDLGLYHAQALWAETGLSASLAERRRLLCLLARLFKEANDPASALKAALSAWKELDPTAGAAARASLDFLLFQIAPRDGSHDEAFAGVEGRLVPVLEELGWDNHLSATLSQVVSARETVERAGLDAALANADRGLALARGQGNLRAAGVALQTIGMLYDLAGRSAEAERAYIQARDTRAPVARDFELARNDNALGYFYFLHGDHGKAFTRHSQALKALSLSRNYEETMGTLFNLGRLYLFNGQPREGLFCMEALLRIKEGLEIEEIPFHSRRNIFSVAGICCLKVGRTGQAGEFARRLSSLPAEDPESHSLDYQRWFECLSTWMLGRGQDSGPLFDEAERVIRSHAGDTRPLLRMLLLDRAAFERASGRPAAERRALSEARALEPQAAVERADPSEAPGRRKADHSLPLLDFDPEVILQFMEQDRTLIRLQRKINEFGFLQAWQEVLRSSKSEQDIYARALDLVKRHFMAGAVRLFAVAGEGTSADPGTSTSPEARRLILTRGDEDPSGEASAFMESRFREWGDSPRYWEGRGTLRGSYLPIRILGSVRNVLWVEAEERGLGEDDHIALVDAAWQLGLALELLRLQEKLTAAASTDALTGLSNRMDFLRRMDYQFKMAKRHGKGQRPDFCLLFIDLDNFKHYNDDYGHAAGDLVLRLFARTLTGLLRTTDMICRYGGDEFVVLLPATDLEGARTTADRVLAAIRAASGYQAELSEQLGRPVELAPEKRLTCSVGISGYEWGVDRPLEEFIAQADKAAYQAKRAGKDRFALA